MQAADTLRSCLYRAAPVFGAPACPVELAADCVALGPVAVDDVGLRFIAYAIAATTSMTTTGAPMPHAARGPGSVDVRGGRWGLEKSYVTPAVVRRPKSAKDCCSRAPMLKSKRRSAARKRACRVKA
jgi:hypothetical protein